MISIWEHKSHKTKFQCELWIVLWWCNSHLQQQGARIKKIRQDAMCMCVRRKEHQHKNMLISIEQSVQRMQMWGNWNPFHVIRHLVCSLCQTISKKFQIFVNTFLSARCCTRKFFYMPCIFQLESACGMICCGLLLLNNSKLCCNGRLFNRHQKSVRRLHPHRVLSVSIYICMSHRN